MSAKNITNNSTTLINIECEDYGTLMSGTTRTYMNSINVIEDYTLSFENTNQSGNLGFLSSRNYASGGTNAFYSDYGNNHKILLIDWNSNLYNQNDNQFLWFSDRDNNDWISSGATLSNAPYILNHSSYNLGTTGITTSVSTMGNISDMFITTPSTDLLCAVFPYLPDVANFVENGQDKTKIIKPQTKFSIGLKIFFKFDGSIDTSSVGTPTEYKAGTGANATKSRKVKLWFETNDSTTYQFIINFNLNRYRTFMKPKTDNNVDIV